MSVWFNNRQRRAVELGTDTEQLELGPDTDFWKANDFHMVKGDKCVQVEGWKIDQGEASVQNYIERKYGYSVADGGCADAGFKNELTTLNKSENVTIWNNL